MFTRLWWPTVTCDDGPAVASQLYSATTARAVGEAAVATASTGGAWTRGCGCSPMTLPRGSYEELVTIHHFIGVAPMRLVEQIRALHDYQGAWVYAHLRPYCFVSLRVRVDGRGVHGFGGV